MACNHPELNFASGDYYVACWGCGARWARINNQKQPEYGEGADGSKIGCTPEEANQGFEESDNSRVRR